MRIIAAALLSSVLLGGCSAIKLGYSNAVELSYWWLDGYLDFQDGQPARVRDDLARLHRWHREQELPRLLPLLRKAEQLAAGEVTPTQACELWDSLRPRLAALGQQAEPALVTTALSLAPEQLDRLAQRNERNNRDWQKNWISPPATKRLDKRLEAFSERGEQIYGRIEAPQRELLRRQLEGSIFDPQRMLTERQRRQADLQQVLRQIQAPRLPLADARALISGYTERVQRSPDPSWQRYQQSLTEETCRIIALTHNTATPAQREHAVKRLRGWQKDLSDLVAGR